MFIVRFILKSFMYMSVFHAQSLGLGGSGAWFVFIYPAASSSQGLHYSTLTPTYTPVLVHPSMFSYSSSFHPQMPLPTTLSTWGSPSYPSSQTPVPHSPSHSLWKWVPSSSAGFQTLHDSAVSMSCYQGSSTPVCHPCLTAQSLRHRTISSSSFNYL